MSAVYEARLGELEQQAVIAEEERRECRDALAALNGKIDALPADIAAAVLDQQAWRHRCVSSFAEKMVNDPWVRRLFAVTVLAAVALVLVGVLDVPPFALQVGDWLGLATTPLTPR